MTQLMNSMAFNPYMLARETDDELLNRLGPVVSDYVGGTFDKFKKIMTSPVLAPEDAKLRIRGNQMLQLAEGTCVQAQVALEMCGKRLGFGKDAVQKALAGESLGTGVNQLTDIVTFTTQMLHLSLNLFPRLYLNQIASVQPMNAPSAFVFYLDEQDDTGRSLHILDSFDANLSADPGEGVQIRKVKHVIRDEVVTAEYHKLMREQSWESMVKMRTQFGMDLSTLNDGLLGQQMVWDIDRIGINRMLAFASATYTFDQTRGGTYNGLAQTEREAWDRNFLRSTWNDMETDMQAQVYQKPNWALAGNECIKFLKRQKGIFETVGAGNPKYGDLNLGNGQIAFSGTYNDCNVWHDPQMDHCTMLTGYTDSMNPFYAGFIFAPFGLASLLTAAFMDPNNLLERKAQAMAFATKGVRSEQIKKIKLGSCS